MKRKASKRTGLCTVVRRVLVTHSRFNIVTGKATPGRSRWETKPCGVPLFTTKERTASTCSSCAAGWQHPDNYPAGRVRPNKESYANVGSRTLTQV